MLLASIEGRRRLAQVRSTLPLEANRFGRRKTRLLARSQSQRERSSSSDLRNPRTLTSHARVWRNEGREAAFLLPCPPDASPLSSSCFFRTLEEAAA